MLVNSSVPHPVLAAETLTGSSTGSFAPADSAQWLNELRRRARQDRLDIDARKLLAEVLGHSSDIELRREAYDALQEAILVTGDDADLWARMARLQERRGFRREARNSFHRALELNPDQPGLWGDLAQHELRRYQRYFRYEHLDKSRTANARTLRHDPDNADALRRGLRISYYTNDRAAVDSLSLRWIEAHPDDPWPSLLRGMLYTEAGAWTLAEESFRAGLTLMTSHELYAFHRLDWIDPDAERERMDTADSTGFFEDYWRWKDPTPADSENPRLLEHYRRLVQAHLLFGIDEMDLYGWDHAPGRMIIRYGLPLDFRWGVDVFRGQESKTSSAHGSPTIGVTYGQRDQSKTFFFVDYNLNGRFYNPIAFVPLAADFTVALDPTDYAAPFSAPNLDQEVELWRFVDGSGRGRIEVAVALPADSWRDVLQEPHRISSKLSRYDPDWSMDDASIWSWSLFEKDELDRLVGVFSIDGTADSVIVGLETLDRLNRGRASGYASLGAQIVDPGSPLLSDIAFLRTLGFDPDEGGRYQRGYGSGIPNPGHRYRTGEALGIAFEAYHLATDRDGYHRARIGITVGQQTRTGFLRVVLGGGGGSQAELVFDAADPGPTLDQLLAVDVPPLKPGDYVLKVRVEDLVAGTTVERESPFVVLKPGRTR